MAIDMPPPSNQVMWCLSAPLMMQVVVWTFRQRFVRRIDLGEKTYFEIWASRGPGGAWSILQFDGDGLACMYAHGPIA